MEIILNDQKKTIDEQSVLQFVVQLAAGDKQKGIAVAVNEQVIPKSEWSNFRLQSNDTVLIIKATQGG